MPKSTTIAIMFNYLPPEELDRLQRQAYELGLAAGVSMERAGRLIANAAIHFKSDDKEMSRLMKLLVSTKRSKKWRRKQRRNRRMSKIYRNKV